ncbi:uncharacterized protein LOC123443757 isoform X1 [Hordeum vulgare subsp. vulgare]|uniref:uncharacterized protein LOC123443757 isoform X1 n=1 Tax=Hordeum vulgare subsp. vulgare TaxID=112509 RepID=UPI001D1A59F8|nr:uncharacterized protein LOC123443757 isoform X1 [Hordeum vulgare subsp. vulgare]
MSQPLNSSRHASNPHATQRVLITNKRGEKLVGLLHPTGLNKIVVLCHGFTASKSSGIIVDLADAIIKKGISVFHFDFSGNGESEGEFQYGNYRKEAEDLHSVVSYLYQEKYDVAAVVGHSKGGDVVVLYASLYDDVHMVVNLSGRFYLEKGIEERLGKEFLDRINKEGYIDVTNKSGNNFAYCVYSLSFVVIYLLSNDSNVGNMLYRVTKESLMERLNTDMRATSLSISKECSFFTVHGSADDIIPVEDAYEFAKHIPTHKLCVVEGADHCYTRHRKELSDAVVGFITSNKARDTTLEDQ